MRGIVNPMDGFMTFQPALDAGEIELQSGDVDPNVYVLLDRPNGEPRFTYVRLENGIASCMAVIVRADPNEGKPAFQIGYAVLDHLRGQGRAKDIAKAAVAELTAGLKRSGVDAFYLEIVAGRDNLASQAVARSLVSVEPNEIIDEDAGHPALQYIELIT